MWHWIEETKPRTTPPKVLLALIAASCVACSEPDASDPPPHESNVAGAPAFASSTPVLGAFAVSLVAATSSTDGFRSVWGRVYDAPMPDRLAWNIAAGALGCELRVPVLPF